MADRPEVGAMRLLVAEDDPKLSRILARGLKEEGYVVDVVTDGSSALWMATENAYDCIVLDVMLPELDGYAVCQALRERGQAAPVLMLTARDAVPDRIRGLDAGADDYMVKPFAFDELLARVRAQVRRRPDWNPSRLEVDDLVLDPATHEVTRGGTPIRLTSKEFTLLRYLMEHQGEVVSRTRILDHVWDWNFEGSSNVVDVYVGYLRNKINHQLGPPLIHTVRGVGYVLERR